jgi:hypothetical protein
MPDTDHHSHLGDAPVEGDGVSYRGIVWFVGVMVITTVASQLLMLGLFKYLARDVAANDLPRAPLSAPALQPPPGPNLALMSSVEAERGRNEPDTLAKFREAEEKKLASYEWIDKGAGTVRIPIDRAKDLLLERGLPVRTAGTPVPATAAKAKPATTSKTGK